MTAKILPFPQPEYCTCPSCKLEARLSQLEWDNYELRCAVTALLKREVKRRWWRW